MCFWQTIKVPYNHKNTPVLKNIWLPTRNYSVITFTLCYLLHQTHSDFWHIQISVYSGKCWYIQAYSALLRHIHANGGIKGIFRFIQGYSAPCLTLAFSQPCHILTPAMFRTRDIFKIAWNIDQPYSELYHIFKNR